MPTIKNKRNRERERKSSSCINISLIKRRMLINRCPHQHEKQQQPQQP
jgi:hypothetical protein